MEVALVVYGQKRVKRQAMIDWCRGVGNTIPLIINNDHNSLHEKDIEGDNSYFEFSAYKQAVHLFTGNGPYLIANDTLFINHFPKAWMEMVNRLIKRNIKAPLVIGDMRFEKKSFPEKGKSFLASWFFYINGRDALSAFKNCLDLALIEAQEKPSAEYEQYVDNWLNKTTPFTGWHGKRNEENLCRKKQVIRIEHALSLELEKVNLMADIGQYYAKYPFVRFIERLKTRYYAIAVK